MRKNQNNLFEIKEKITEDLFKKFKMFIRSLPPDTKKIYIRIDSDGGNRWAAVKLIKLIYFLEVNKNITIITQAILAGSAAMQIFASGTKREVSKESRGYIHFPEIRGHIPSPEHQRMMALLRKRVIAQLIGLSRQLLNEAKIIELHLKDLYAYDMLNYGLADKFVEKFDSD